MRVAHALLEEALSAWTPWIVVAVALATLTTRGKGRVRMANFFLAVHLILVLVGAALSSLGSSSYADVHLVTSLLGTLAIVSAAGAVLFHGVLPRLHITAPQIIQDVSVASAALVVLLFVASRKGLNLSGIVATSAVLTAVVGLSLQDTLGNILGGIALQTDESIKVGDWIQVGDVTGRVANIHWRYTAVETRDWETVVVPNSVLIKTQVTVLGRRTDQPLQLRRSVNFNVDFRFPPPEVIRVVTEALHAAPMPNVARQPLPDVVLREFHESWARYTARYYLTNIAVDDPTDSQIRERIYFALSRAGMNLSIPAQALFLTQDSSERRAQKQGQFSERKCHAIEVAGLFASLSRGDQAELAESLVYAPFAKGEALTRQGGRAHWLYIIEEGECAVQVEVDGRQRQIATLRAGDFMGEMSLLTGAERSATVVAQTDVQCWRLGRTDFESLLKRRPEIAEEVAETLAKRQVELDRARHDLTEEHHLDALERKRDLTEKIRSFFGMDP